MVYKYKYNKQEEMYYNLKDDCIFNTSCLLPPNNYSFVNYTRPQNKSGLFYSDKVDVDKNFNMLIQRNCNNNCTKKSLKTCDLCLK